MAENFNFGYDLFDSLSSDWLTYRKVSPIFLVSGRVSSSAFGEKISSDGIWQIGGQHLGLIEEHWEGIDTEASGFWRQFQSGGELWIYDEVILLPEFHIL